MNSMKKLFLILLLVLTFASKVQAVTYEQASAQGKTMVLYLYMTTCSACKEFESTYNSVASKYLNKFNFVKENISYSQIASTLRPSGVPAVYILEPSTRTAQKITYECITNQACFEETLNKYSQK